MTYAEAIADATVAALSADPHAIVLGVGVADEKGIFGTTRAARVVYPDRVLETPLSENMLTGALMGLIHASMKPMLVHARADFTTLSAEHLINTLAKWSFMSGNPRYPVPAAVRAIIGQGFGQGPQHSQSLAHIFAGVPGLDVLMPYDVPTAAQAVRNWPNAYKPRVIIEHRRLYNSTFEFDCDKYQQAEWEADIQIVACSAAVMDAVAAAEILEAEGKRVNITPWNRVSEPAEAMPDETRGAGNEYGAPVLYVDVAPAPGVMASAMAYYTQRSMAYQPAGNMKLLTPPSYPCPTSFALEQGWYVTSQDIAHAAGKMIGVDIPLTNSTAFQTGESF